MNAQSDFITRVRQVSQEFITVLDKFTALEKESLSLKYDTLLNMEAFTGENSGKTPEEIMAVFKELNKITRDVFYKAK